MAPLWQFVRTTLLSVVTPLLTAQSLLTFPTSLTKKSFTYSGGPAVHNISEQPRLSDVAPLHHLSGRP